MSLQKHKPAQTLGPWKLQYTIKEGVGRDLFLRRPRGREAKQSALHSRKAHLSWDWLRSQLQLILKEGLPVGDSSSGVQFCQSHQEQFMDLSNLHSCKLDLVSAFLDCKTNTCRELKMPAYLDRVAIENIQLEHFIETIFIQASF